MKANGVRFKAEMDENGKVALIGVQTNGNEVKLITVPKEEMFPYAELLD